MTVRADEALRAAVRGAPPARHARAKAHRGCPNGPGDAAPVGQLPAGHRVHRRAEGPAGAGVLRPGRALAIAGSYRVQERGWGATEDSTGGYCAAKLAILDSDVFTAAVTLSGYFHTLRTARRGAVGRLTGAEEPQQPGVAPPPPPAAPVSLLVTTAKDEAGSSGY